MHASVEWFGDLHSYVEFYDAYALLFLHHLSLHVPEDPVHDERTDKRLADHLARRMLYSHGGRSQSVTQRIAVLRDLERYVLLQSDLLLPVPLKLLCTYSH